MQNLLMFMMGGAALLGAWDCIRGNRLGLGRQFEEGFLCLGASALNMVGIICVAPALAGLLGPVIRFFYGILGADPAMFGSLFANNMGGYQLSMALADSRPAGEFAGLVVSSMLGASIVYTIPVGMELVGKENQKWFAQGVMLGLAAVPGGSLAGGLVMGLPLGMLARNTLPIVLTAGALLAGFTWFRESLMKNFLVFARGIRCVAVAALGIAAFRYMTGIVLIPGMLDIREAMEIIGEMGVTQLGSLPLAVCFTQAFRKPFQWIGKAAGISSQAVAAIPVCCVNAVAAFTMMRDMDPKGIVVNAAWITGSICVFTAHLAFTRAVSPGLLAAVMTGKMVCGVLAVVIVLGAWKLTGMSGRNMSQT